MLVKIKRAYVSPDEFDGYRVLVDRLWPRGISKSDIGIDEWQKDCAPTSELRKWFGHDADKWDEFSRRYTAELGVNKEKVTGFVSRAKKGPLTLVYGAKDEEHNQAVVLKRFIEDRVI